MFVFKHPKYYKELRASLKKEAISPDESTDSDGRAPSDKPQAPSSKPQASSRKQQAPGYFFPDKVLQRQESGSLLR